MTESSGMSMQLRIASILAILALAAAWGLMRTHNAELERAARTTEAS